MTLKLSRNAVLLLNVFLRQDNLLPLVQAGLLASQGVGRPFTAEGPEMAKKIIALRRKWLEPLVLKMAKGSTGTDAKFPAEGEFIEVPLIKSYVGVLQKMLDYYKPVGLQPQWADNFAELQACLNGKTLDEELDSIEEMTNEPVKLVEADKEGEKEKAKSA